jgi:hypothetical protein
MARITANMRAAAGMGSATTRYAGMTAAAWPARTIAGIMIARIMISGAMSAGAAIVTVMPVMTTAPSTADHADTDAVSGIRIEAVVVIAITAVITVAAIAIATVIAISARIDAIACATRQQGQRGHGA